MDIVDINKVLDDLELNEEQHSKINTTPDLNENKPNDLYSSYKYDLGQRAGVPQTITTNSSTNVPPIPSRITKTNFVKVSNVFNR